MLAPNDFDTSEGPKARHLSATPSDVYIKEGWLLLEWASFLDTAKAVNEVNVSPQVVDRYVRLALKQARLEELDDGTHYASIPVLQGVWAVADNPVDALEELTNVAHEWVVLKLLDRDTDLPPMGDMDLRLPR